MLLPHHSPYCKHTQQNIKRQKTLSELTHRGYSNHISRSLLQTWQNNEWNHSAVVAMCRYVTSYQRAAYHAQEVILSRDRLIISVFCVIHTSPVLPQHCWTPHYWHNPDIGSVPLNPAHPRGKNCTTQMTTSIVSCTIPNISVPQQIIPTNSAIPPPPASTVKRQQSTQILQYPITAKTILSFNSLSFDRSTASSTVISPHCAT
jgi:hypothetical protein